MMQRICPVCDQVMKHAHYCSACHSWVKDPMYMNVTAGFTGHDEKSQIVS